jgi:iron complex transport system ATP-binding protein
MNGALRIESLSVRLGDRMVIDDLDLAIAAGQFVALVGPNGSGKTTLLRTLFGAIAPHAGTAFFDDVDASSLSAVQRARIVAAMTQNDDLPLGLHVRDVVALGRLPHLGRAQRIAAYDLEAIADGINVAGIQHLIERPYANLSGGERQRVHLARVLAQRTPVLLLDEPTNHLDIAAQLELLDAVRQLDVTVVVSLHDLNHAATYADTVVVLAEGRAVAAGTPPEVLTPELIEATYGVHTVCGNHPVHGRLQLSFAPIAPSQPYRTEFVGASSHPESTIRS